MDFPATGMGDWEVRKWNKTEALEKVEVEKGEEKE